VFVNRVHRRDGWVGYSLDKMKYFIFVWLDRPEVVVFERYQIGSTDSFDGTLGELRETRGVTVCDNELDLADRSPRFFGAPMADQQKTLVEFFASSLLHAERFDPVAADGGRGHR
jgi:hypothetical protein